MGNRPKTKQHRKRKAVAVMFPDESRGVHLIDTTVKRWERDAATIQHVFEHVAHDPNHEHTLEGLGHDDLMNVELMLVEYDPATLTEHPDGTPTKHWPDVVSYCAEFGVEVDDSVPFVGTPGPLATIETQPIWDAWNALPNKDPEDSPIKTIARDLGLTWREVADVIFPQPHFFWDEREEPDLP